MRCRLLEDLEKGGNFWIERFVFLDEKHDLLDELKSKGYVQVNGNSHSGNNNGKRGHHFSGDVYKVLKNLIGSEYVTYNRKK
jgi:hypothetical protein